jgi:hypothetical protein
MMKVTTAIVAQIKKAGWVILLNIIGRQSYQDTRIRGRGYQGINVTGVTKENIK